MFEKVKAISRRSFFSKYSMPAAGMAFLNSCTRETDRFQKWTFVYANNIHYGSPDSFRFQPAWNENWETACSQISEINPDFILIGGDLTRDGKLHRWEFENLKKYMDSLSIPYHVLPGNMDVGNKFTSITGPRTDRNDIDLNVTSETIEQYRSVFGDPWWSFVHKNLRVSGFCDMLMGSGLPQERELIQWFEEQKPLPRSAKYHVWMMHYPLFVENLHEENYDITDPDQYMNWYSNIDEPQRSYIMDVFRITKADRVITGHLHIRKDQFVENIHFDWAPSTASPSSSRTDGDPTLGFLRYDVSGEGIEKTFIPLEKVSTLKGYGPEGHPRPEKKDYPGN